MNTLHMAVAHKQKEIVELLLKVKLTDVSRKQLLAAQKKISRSFLE